jgi:hypothetical protein
MSKLSQYADKFGRVAGVQQNMARLSEVLGDTGNPALTRFLTKSSVGAEADVKDGLGTVVGAAAGAYLGWKRGHWLLGTIGGASAGRNVPALLDPGTRKTALVNMGQTGAAIALSLASPKHPAVAFVVGEIVAGAAIYFWKLR